MWNIVKKFVKKLNNKSEIVNPELFPKNRSVEVKECFYGQKVTTLFVTASKNWLS